MKLLAAYTTVSTADQARQLAREMVQRKLAACAQISTIESFYTWQGAVQHEPECRIVFKTTAARYPALEAALRKLHPYELPAIYAVPVEHAEPAYAGWVESEVQSASKG